MVQITSDPRIPIGMSRWGFLASCAVVETASNPMNAKKTTPAPRRMPLQPKWPNSPVLGGMNEPPQLADETWLIPTAMNSSPHAHAGSRPATRS